MSIPLKISKDNEIFTITNEAPKYTDEEVKYSYDCEHCYFRKFMAYFGLDMNIDTCLIDCTESIKKEADEIYQMILEKMYFNDQGAILYLGNISNNKYIS